MKAKVSVVSPVSHNDLLEAIRQAFATKEGTEDGFTGAELGRTLGCSAGRACNAIRQLLEDKKVERVRIKREGIDGRMLVLTGYRLRQTK